ncbi:MAG: 23S rRNA (pseudouridine(1915)-N(3))-methyltransferase RlmH [Bacilli bacterium]|nr:23S rRNA (pseudouridine(1915)-N(3))-methyltransferase RlmH [Bacilli bacterium]MDD4808639.1 23S rRNA (pseudouridine(1915)-N(3))-methyltransferase RlmH [Bacilli bacterium]
MMIKIIAVGKIKEKYFKEAIDEYTKRLSRYTKLKIIEVEDIDLSNPTLSLEKERDNLIKYIDKNDYVIVLDIKGESLNSLELSKKIDNTLINYSNITFIIGGSYGLHEDIKKRSDYQLSFSKLTFPHQMFRVLLLEQIYRSFKIIKNESYHK